MSRNIRELKELYNKYTISHKWKKAINVIDKIIEQEPDNAKFILRRGMIFYKQKKWRKAQIDISKALELDSSLKHAYQIQSSISRKLNSKIAFDEDVTLEELVVTPAVQKPLSLEKEALQHTDKKIGRYIIKSEIGRGGMGKVYKVFDPNLDRIVALKVLLEGSESRPEQIKRFLREAKATAKLHHPNIIALHDINHQNNFVFFTMDYIDGETLKSYSSQQDLSIKEIVNITITISQAIHYAHNEGIVHRDLKPANVMITKNREVKVMDFGLAKMVHSNDELSRTGDSMGTPAYMSPEQADGEKVDARTDVYALGTILYQLLVGRPPFVGENHYNVLFQVLSKDPILPRKLNPDISLELEAICLKCLEKKPEKRYSSANLLAEDLQNFLNNRPITAKPATVVTLAVKFIKRHRTWAIAGFLLLLSIFVGTFTTFIQWQEALEQKQQAERDRRNTVFRLAKITLAKAQEYFNSQEQQKWQKCGSMAVAAIELVGEYKGNDKLEIVHRAQSLIRIALQRNGILWETNYFGVAPVREEYAISKVTSHEPAPLQVAFCKEKILSGSWDGKISFYERKTGKKNREITVHHLSIAHLIAHPKQPIFAFAANDDQVSLWNSETEKAITLFIHNGFVSSLSFSRDGKFIAAGGKDGVCKIWSLASQKVIATIPHGIKEVTAIAFSASTNHFVSAADNMIKIWDISSQELLHQKTCAQTIRSLQFHHSGTMLLSASENHIIDLWSFPQMKKLHSWKTKSSVINLQSSHNNDFFICACENGEILVYDVVSRGLHHIFRKTHMPISSIDISRDDNYLISASLANSIEIWDLKTGKPIHNKNGHTNAISKVIFHPEGKIVASSSYDGTVRICNALSGEQIRELPHNAYIYSCCFSRSGNLLATTTDKEIQVWNWQTGKLIQVFYGKKFTDVAFNFDDSLIAGSSQSGDTTIWFLSSGKKHSVISLHKDQVWNIDFHPFYDMLVSVSEDRSLRIWDLNKNEEAGKLEYPLEHFAFTTVKFSPDGEKIAYAGQSKTIFIFNIMNQKITELHGHVGSVNDISFDSTNKFIASCADDKRVYVWNIADRKQVKDFSNFNWVNSIAFHPKKNLLVGGDQDGILKLWKLSYLEKYRKDLKVSGAFLRPQKNGSTYATLQELRKISLYTFATSKVETVFTLKDSEAYGIDYSQDGRFIALATVSKGIKIFDIEQQKIVKSFMGHDAPVWSVALSNNNKLLASSSKDRTIILWDLDTGKKLHHLFGHHLSVYRISFSPDSKMIASASEDRSVKVWDVASGKILETLTEKDLITINVIFSHDGKKLAYSASQNVFIWDLEKREKKELQGHRGFITDLAFSPDNKILASSSYDKTIRLWNTDSGLLEDELIGHTQTAANIAFHPKKPVIISIAQDKTIRHWRRPQITNRVVMQVPFYLKNIIAADEYIKPRKEQFIHHNISSDVIIHACDNPQPHLSRELFQFEVGETLQLKHKKRSSYLWSSEFSLDNSLVEKYLEQAQEYGSGALSIDCLQVAISIDPGIVPRIRQQYPKLSPSLAKRYLYIAETSIDIDKIKKNCRIVLKLDENNKEAQDIFQQIK
ncbi:protein kinase [Candidatus Uabimicrobium sp. HlEnr_7]|uniref:protein kinase domain-containing protein n=1 Tax=Candidatus Uabimicrobium helgolandensis TaxID=3095367 RepID=UPI0035560C70